MTSHPLKRLVVTKWLHYFEENLSSNRQSDNSQSESRDGRSKPEFMGDSSEESEGRTPVSIVNLRMMPKNKRLGSTVSHDGPNSNREGSTASSGGPTDSGKASPRPSHKRKWSTASKGGPNSSSQSQSDDTEYQSKPKKLESGTDRDEDDLSDKFDLASSVTS